MFTIRNLTFAVTLSLTCSIACAQTTLTQVWKINPGERAWFTANPAGHLVRSIQYNAATDHVTAVSRDASVIGYPTLQVLNAATGAEITSISLASALTSGTFYINKHAHDATGVTYIANLTTDWSKVPYIIYRLGSETGTLAAAYASTSTLLGSGSGATVGARIGDTLAVTGTGADTVIWAGSRTKQGPHMVKFTTTDGISFTPTATVTTPGVFPVDAPSYNGLAALGPSASPTIWMNGPGYAARSINPATGMPLLTIDETIVPQALNLVPINEFQAFGQRIVAMGPGNFSTGTLEQARGHLVKIGPDGQKVLAAVTEYIHFNDVYTNGNGAGSVAFDPTRNNVIFGVTNVSISAHAVTDLSAVPFPEFTAVHSGQYAAKLTNTTPGDVFVADTGLDRDASRIAVTAGTTYTLSFWMRNARPEASRLFAVRIAEFASGGAFISDANLATDLAATADWTRVVLAYGAGATTAEANVAFRAAPDGSSVLIDDVSFTLATGGVELVTNGGFEAWPDGGSPTDWRFFTAGTATGTLERSEGPPPTAARDWHLLE